MKTFKSNLFVVLILVFALFKTVNSQNLSPKKDKATKKYGFVNKADEWVIQPIYEDADKFKDGIAHMYMNKKTGLISETGVILFEPKFDDIEKFKDNIAIVKDNKKYGFIDNTGKVLSEPIFDEIEKFTTDGIAIIKNNKKSGLIKNNGTVLLDPKFDDIESFSGDVANVKNGNLWGLIDKTGKVIFDAEFIAKLEFNSKGLSVATKKGESGLGKFGIVKRDGTVVLDFNQILIRVEAQKFFVNKESGKWEIFDASATSLSGEFEEFSRFDESLTAKSRFIVSGMIAAKQNGKWGFIDETGKTLIPFQYDRVGSDNFAFSQNYCAVQVGEKWGFIDKKGNYLKEPTFESVDHFIKMGEETVTTVKLDKKEYVLNVNGQMTLKAGPQETASSQTSETTKSNSTTTSTNAATTTTTTTTSTSETANNDWIVGTWKVTEEKIGGSPKTGNQTKFVSWTFKISGGASYIERYDIMANQTTTKNTSWKLDGKTLKMDNVNYTVTPSADKKSMTLNGIMGSTWKLIKQ